MKLLPLLILAGIVIALACNKDKFTSIPQVKIKSISPSTLFSGNLLRIHGSYTDQEGDIDTVFVVMKYFNGATATRIDTLEKINFKTIGVPEKTMEADIDIVYEYNTNNTNNRILSGVQKDTTAAFGLVLKDKQANRSEYKESEKIRIKKP